ncbi:MAG: rhamnan synthesis F family protein, partial [Rhodospirillales bacterium]|nr:rhamnan synthesis F family protein [Rhodospirillales bacterium]
MTNFIKSLFYSRKANVKKYKFLGLTIVKIRKLPYKKSVKIFNLVKFSNKVKYKFSLKQIISFYFNRIWGKIIYKKQIKQNKKTKILICLHMFYPQAWKLITKYLHNLDCYQYDLLITYTKDNFDDVIVTQMQNFKVGTKVVAYENKGFDVGPFIDCLNNVDLT